MKKKERMGFITLFIFLILSAFAIVCLESGLIIHAEGNDKLSDIYGYDFTTRKVFTSAGWQASTLYQNYSYHFGTVSSPNEAYYQALNDLTLPSGIDYDVYPNFFIWKYEASISSGYLFVYLFEDGIRCASGYNCNGFGYEGGEAKTYCRIWYTYSNGTFTLAGQSLGVDMPTNNNRKIGLFTSDRDTGRFIASNIDDVYGAKTSSESTYSSLFDNCISPSSPSSNYYKMNYLIYNSEGEIDYVNPITNGGVSADTIEQGLYLLKGSCVYLENTSFNKGTLHVNALLSEDQKNNPNLVVMIKGSCSYDMEQTVVSRTYTWAKYGSSNMADAVYPSESFTTWNKTVSAHLGVFDRYDIALSSFENSKWSIPLSTVNNNMYTTDIMQSSNNSFFGSTMGAVASGYDDALSNKFTVGNYTLNGENVSFNVGYVPANNLKVNPMLNSVVYTFDLYVCDMNDEDNIVWSDLIYEYTINMISGQASVPTDGTVSYDDLNNAFDGNVPNQYLPSEQLDNTGSSSTSSSGGNSLINNDNDTININGNGEVARDIVNDLIPSDGVGGFTEQIENTLQANSWMQVVRTTFSFIPTSVFTQISLYVITVLGILAAAFVLRIILDLL